MRIHRLVPVLASALALTLASPSNVLAKPAEVSDALKVQRPAEGEWFGLYLLGKKVGHIYMQGGPLPGQPARARFVNELVFKANVGQRESERRHREERIYEARPNGRLLSFVVQQTGDGGNMTVEATNTPKGLKVVRKRPGQADDVRNLPPSPETIEAADQARVALLRSAPLKHEITDGTDLQTYALQSKVLAPQTRTLGGVTMKVRRVESISQKEKVATIAAFAPDGRTIEVTMGDTMRAVAEPKDVARRLDKVEVFGLTRVVLPSPIPEARRKVPGDLKLVVTGMPSKFHRDSHRQKHVDLGGGRTEIRLSAAAPAADKRLTLPFKKTPVAEYLKSTLIVESDHPEVRAAAKKVVGGEKDAYLAAQKISTWVHANLRRDYGASADRASDVLRQKKGDCTEHSLLAVAMMRASGIPARRVDGLVYLMNEDGVPALYWHEWVEAWVGEWTQMDPTFGQIVADATHVGLGEEGGAEITQLIGALKVVEVR